MWILEQSLNSKWSTCIHPNTMSFKMRCLFEFRWLHKVLATVWTRSMDENHHTAKTLHLPAIISKIKISVSKEEVLIILYVLKYVSLLMYLELTFSTSERCLLLQLHISVHEDNVLFTNTKRERPEEPWRLGTDVFTTCAIIGHHWEVKVKVGPLEPRPTPRCVKVRSRASPSVRLSGHRKLPHPDRDGHPVTQRIVLQDLAEEQREVGV